MHATVRLGVSAGIAATAVALLFSVPRSVGTSWASVLGAFAALPVLTLAVLAALWIAGLTCNSVALAASLPGLTTRRALALSLSGSAVANLLPLGGAAELLDLAAGLHEGLLDDVGRIDLALELPANLKAGEEGEVAAVRFEQSAEGDGVAAAGFGEEGLGFGCHEPRWIGWIGSANPPRAPRRGRTSQVKRLR